MSRDRKRCYRPPCSIDSVSNATSALFTSKPTSTRASITRVHLEGEVARERGTPKCAQDPRQKKSHQRYNTRFSFSSTKLFLSFRSPHTLFHYSIPLPHAHPIPQRLLQRSPTRHRRVYDTRQLLHPPRLTLDHPGGAAPVGAHDDVVEAGEVEAVGLGGWRGCGVR